MASAWKKMESADSVDDQIPRSTPVSKGRVSLIVGCMFSGKTSTILRLARRYKIAGKCVLIINHTKDAERAGSPDLARSHDDITSDALSASTLMSPEVLRAVQAHDVIAVDEAQFFPDTAEATEKWADAGKIVIVAALDTTYKRKPFETMRDVVADDITKLTAVCANCSDEASFTWRMSDEDEVDVVGGEDKYRAVCRACYNKLASNAAAKVDATRKRDARADADDMPALADPVDVNPPDSRDGLTGGTGAWDAPDLRTFQVLSSGRGGEFP